MCQLSKYCLRLCKMSDLLWNIFRLVNQELRDKLQKLQKAQEGSLSDSEKDELLPSLPGEKKENGNEINGIPVHQKNGSDVELTKEQVKR